MTARRLWVDAVLLAVGWCLGWVAADAWLRGRYENDAGDILDWP